MSVRFAEGVLWFAGAVCLLLAVRADSARGQTDKALAHSVANTAAAAHGRWHRPYRCKAERPAAEASHRELGLLQRRLHRSALQQDDPDYTGEREPHDSAVGLPHPRTRPDGSDTSGRRGSDVRYQRERRLRVGCEDGQAIVASCAGHHPGAGGRRRRSSQPWRRDPWHAHLHGDGQRAPAVSRRTLRQSYLGCPLRHRQQELRCHQRTPDRARQSAGWNVGRRRRRARIPGRIRCADRQGGMAVLDDPRPGREGQ